MRGIYLDHAAATATRVEVEETMRLYTLENYGNPSALHQSGKTAREALSAAREKAAILLNASHSSEIVFTSGGTESVNLALKGIALAHKHLGKHIITSAIEHEAVLKTCEYLEQYEGFTITYVPVDKYGMVDPSDIETAIRSDTILISIMYVNNEVGTIQPILEITAIAKKHKIIVHTDACQAGWQDINVQALGVDLMTLNSTKLYGPKGVGLLYIRKGISLIPLLHGGNQEYGLRSGTENVPAIVGFVKALELAQQEKELESDRLTQLRDYFIQNILKAIAHARLNGHPQQRVANNVNISFDGIEGEMLLLYLNQYGIYASSGSACTSHAIMTSHVLRAMGYSGEGTVRFTLGRTTTQEEIDSVLQILPMIINSLRKIEVKN